MSSDSFVMLTDARVTHPYKQYENQQRLVHELKWRCCSNCVRLAVDKRSCSVNGEAIPPAVAVVGCSSYNDLPF